MFVFFIFIFKSCSSFDDLLAFKTSWLLADWCKFSVHLGNLNVPHVEMAEAMGLKIMASRPPSMA
jgi:hypothetical protein